jgi:hypothetical protein
VVIESIHRRGGPEMLDLLVNAEIAREKTRQSLGGEVPAKRSPETAPTRRFAIRARSAAALRGLADAIEPSRRDAVSA